MVSSQSGWRKKDTILVQTCEILQHHIPSSPGHSRQDSMDPGNLDLDSGRCSCPSSSTHGMKPLERRRKREHQRCLAHSLVGTPNYIAPEVIFVILLIFQDASPLMVEHKDAYRSIIFFHITSCFKRSPISSLSMFAIDTLK